MSDSRHSLGAWGPYAQRLGVEIALKAAGIFRRHLDPSRPPRLKPDGIVDINSQVYGPDLAVFSAIWEAADEAFNLVDSGPPDPEGSGAPC